MTKLTEIIEELQGQAKTGNFNVLSLRCVVQRLQAFENALELEYEHAQRIIRDAIVGYQEAFPYAPNSDAEGELMGRADAANNWLRDHGFEQEKLNWNKEVLCC